MEATIPPCTCTIDSPGTAREARILDRECPRHREPTDGQDGAVRALRAALDAGSGRPERRMRSLVDDAHAAIDDALDAALVAGRADSLADLRPGELTASNARQLAHAAGIRREHAHACLHTLVRGVR